TLVRVRSDPTTIHTPLQQLVSQGACCMTIDSDRSAEEIAADFNRGEEELAAEFKRRFDDGLTPEQRARQEGIGEGWELRDKEYREAAQKHRSGKDKRPKIIKASQIKPEKLTWFYRINGEGVQPLKVTTMLGGIGGEGKSVFSTNQASLLSRGELEGDLYGQKHGTIVFGPEDDWSTVHIPRFKIGRASCRERASRPGRPRTEEQPASPRSHM